jgi:hypothetical protein
MSYHPLSNDTGGDADSRRAEASRLLKIMVENDLDFGDCTTSERKFLEGMVDDEQQPISPKQLFWLRDLKDKYL